MVLKIIRTKINNFGCFGEFELIINSKLALKGVTLEPILEGLTPNQKLRIPAGSYKTIWFNSPKFKQVLPNLYSPNVPVQRRILIHAGNYLKDTIGCILVGASTDYKMIMQSRKTLNDLIKLASYKNFQIEIFNRF